MCCFRVCDGRRCVSSGFVMVRDVLFQGLCWSEMCYFWVCADQICVILGFVLIRDVLFLGS